MPHFDSSPFAVTSLGYKSCLIVLEAPRKARDGWLCHARIVLGGRLNLPLPPAGGAFPEEARSAAEAAARAAVDRLDQDK